MGVSGHVSIMSLVKRSPSLLFPFFPTVQSALLSDHMVLPLSLVHPGVAWAPSLKKGVEYSFEEARKTAPFEFKSVVLPIGQSRWKQSPYVKDRVGKMMVTRVP